MQRLNEHQLESLLAGAQADQVAKAIHDVAEAEWNRFDIELAGLDLGEVQDVVDDPQQRFGRAMDLLHIVELLRVEAALQGQVGHAENGVHRRTDLMAHVGQEVALGLVGGFGRQSRVPIRLGLPASADVASDADRTGHVSVAVVQYRLDGLDQGTAPVGVDVVFLYPLASVRRHHFDVVGTIGVGELRGVNFMVGLAGHLSRVGKAFRGGERAVDRHVVAAGVLHPREVGDVVQDRSHARIGGAKLHRVPPQPFAHRVQGIHQLVEFVAFARQPPQSQRRGLRVRRDAPQRRGDLQQVAGRQPVHDEQDEKGDQESLGRVAQEDDDGLRRQAAVDVRQRRLDMEHADDLRCCAAAHQWKLLDDRIGTLSLAAENRQCMGGRRALPHFHGPHGRQSQDAFELLLQLPGIQRPQAFAQAARGGLIDLGESALEARPLAAIAQGQLQHGQGQRDRGAEQQDADQQRDRDAAARHPQHRRQPAATRRLRVRIGYGEGHR